MRFQFIQVNKYVKNVDQNFQHLLAKEKILDHVYVQKQVGILLGITSRFIIEVHMSWIIAMSLTKLK